MKKLRDENNFGPNLTGKASGNPAEFLKRQQFNNNYE